MTDMNRRLRCHHGVTFGRRSDGSPTPCSGCAVEWSRLCIADAEATIARHQRIIARATLTAIQEEAA